MNATTTELSIGFSHEELAVLTGLLGSPPVPGAAVGPYARAGRDVLDAAARSLRARGVLSADGVGMAAAVADLLRIVTAPQASIEIETTGPGQSRRHRYALSGPAGIDHVDQAGVHRFTPFAAVDVLVRLADLTGLTDPAGQPAIDASAALPAGTVPAGVVTVREAALRAAAAHTAPDRSAAELVAGGVSRGEAALLAELIADRPSTVSVRVRRSTGAGRVEGMDVGWANTRRGMVSWPVGPAGTDPWPDADRQVTVAPLEVRQLLADLAESLAGAPTEDRQ